jgi:hypothetical protein
VVLAERLRTMNEPLERDIAIHALIGKEWLAGRALYVDLWNHKPPLSFLIHAFAIQVFGFGDNAVLALNLFFCLWTLAGLFFFTRMLTEHPWAPLLAAGAWALLSFNLPLQANQPNSEAMANAWLVSGLAVWYAVLTGRLSLRWMGLAGLLFFLTTLLKQHYAAIPLLFGLASVGWGQDRPSAGRALAIVVGSSWWAASLLAGWWSSECSFTKAPWLPLLRPLSPTTPAMSGVSRRSL